MSTVWRAAGSAGAAAIVRCGSEYSLQIELGPAPSRAFRLTLDELVQLTQALSFETDRRLAERPASR